MIVLTKRISEDLQRSGLGVLQATNFRGVSSSEKKGAIVVDYQNRLGDFEILFQSQLQIRFFGESFGELGYWRSFGAVRNEMRSVV